MTQKEAIDRIKRTLQRKADWRNEFSKQYAGVDNLYVYMKEQTLV